MKRIAVVGAGGFARELKWLIGEISEGTGEWEFLGFVVSDIGKLGPNDSRDEVLGDFEWLADHPRSLDALAVGIGTPSVRRKVGRELQQRFPEIEYPSLVHPSVRFDHDTCVIQEGVVICAGAIATVNVRFEKFCLLNLSCTVGHEAVIGEGAVLNPTVNISGGVRVAAGVLVGTGAQVLQYVSIGEGATVGAGAVVTKDVAAGSTVVGIPAKPLQR